MLYLFRRYTCKTMLAQERKNKIMDLVTTNKIVKVSELSELFHTTEVTIRRDLDELQAKKKLRRIHGGAIPITSASRSFSQEELSIRCPEEKKQIARCCIDFINDNDALLFDASTTSLELVRLLASGSKKNLTVVTNSFQAVDLLKDRADFHLFQIGGQVSRNMNSTFGALSALVLRNIRVDKCFIGTSGIDINFGYSDPILDDTTIKSEMLSASKQKFIIADHTKFNDSYIGKFADFTGTIDYLITDRLPRGIDREYIEANVNLIVAGEQNI